jgi:uncharacterized protein
MRIKDKAFSGRRRELKLLEDAYHSSRSELLVLYGRRRVGKSRLIEEFSRDKSAFFFEGLEGGRTPVQLKQVTEQLIKQCSDPLLNSVSFSSWRVFFDYLTEKIFKSRGKNILFLDEFQWLAAGQSRLVSLIKYYWDQHWKSKNVMIILCGSIASFMVKKVIHSTALYGRITQEILLKGLAPAEAYPLFQKKRSQEEVLQYLLLFGGIPRYLEEIQLNRSLAQNINRLCFGKNAFMVSEFEKIFYAQFKEAHVYKRIVSFLKERILTLDELSRKLDIPSGGGLKQYLTNLENAEIVRTVVPFGSSPKTKIKKYKLIDEYLLFYFKYIEPHLRLIQENPSQKLFETLTQKSWFPWLGNAFERFCLKHAALLAKAFGFQDEVVEIAPYFERGDPAFQIDLLYRRSSNIVTLCEVKYWQQPISTKVIPEVERKCQLLKLPRGTTLERALISPYGPDQALNEAQYFHHSLVLDDFFQTLP